ncbi:phosphatidylglycerophosphatase A [Pseudoruegeria sp. HB172150]|uniref:phosphatidylglycerophosphatase A family protein n=1 Tax=Pseudoruegeria sp. HB172150 TaxID=2721164 RepID=UPI0015571C2B|nr:phosphatidylglycerophosphatase A [Pseudoruegeria sp. HB172150]
MSRLIATFFYVGYLPWAPGTWGTAFAIPVAWVLHGLGGFPLLVAATIVVVLAGWWATSMETQGATDHDPSEIVIDEVAGVWIALWPLSGGLWHAGVDSWVFPWPGWVGAFIFFRLFDIWKPGPVGWADRRGDALGVMLDDLIAGVMAAVVIGIAAFVAHGLMGV